MTLRPLPQPLAFPLALSVAVLPAQDADPGSPAKIDGRAVYLAHCASCHGETGRGDGVKGLEPPPRDFTSGKFSFGNTKKALTRTVEEGVPPHMSAFKLELSAREIRAVVRHVQTLMPARVEAPRRISRVRVGSEPRILRGYLPARKGEELPIARGLAIGMPGGVSFEYRTDELRLLRVFTGDFVDRRDWRGRGGTPLEFLGKLLYADEAGNPPPAIRVVRETESHPARVRFKGTWNFDGQARILGRVLDASYQPIVPLEEKMRGLSVELPEGKRAPGYTRSLTFFHAQEPCTLQMRVASFRLGYSSLELERKLPEHETTKDVQALARYPEHFECVILRLPRGVAASPLLELNRLYLDVEVQDRFPVTVELSFFRLPEWSEEMMERISQKLDR
ncbi:MAG: c-type cytochrome [Planctomycetota bacterium]